MQPWHKVVDPRPEVREGRSFSPDEFAIALDQVVAGTAPDDYQKPEQFFARNYFTRALREHCGMVLRRLDGQTRDTSPVLSLVTQFGGGKTHTLTTLYHLAKTGKGASKFTGINELLGISGISEIPKAEIGVFVGSAWDPQEGRENPWIDVARQIAGDAGVKALGPTAANSPPGTEALNRLFDAANAPVLLLFDEVLNFINRHRDFADPFHAFIQNLTIATAGSKNVAAVVSLPRSQVEMGDWDIRWQEKITKVVKRIAKDLISNDETEISEVVRRRLFESLGSEKVRQNTAREYADWCFENRGQIPPGLTAVDTSSTPKKAKDLLQARFEACYPFHPATLSVFQRKWAALPQFQQTRSTLAMLAEWISIVYDKGYRKGSKEPLITLGFAPLEKPGFRATILGMLGEQRLNSAIGADLADEQAHARTLDADQKGDLDEIHKRVGTVILFESSGGHANNAALLPELRFAVGGPSVDTATVDNAAMALESKAFFIRKHGADGYRILYKPTLKKVVNDRRASLDLETEVRPWIQQAVKREFDSGATIPVVCFPQDSESVPDSPKLKLVVGDPDLEWENGKLREQISNWTRHRGKSGRLYPGALIWCFKKQGRELLEKAEMVLAWRKVESDINAGVLGDEFDRTDIRDVSVQRKASEDAVREEIWASFRFVSIADSTQQDGLRVFDLGAGHSSAGQTLCARILSVLKSENLLNEVVGAGYILRNWPPALKESGAWPLEGLRQSFLNGSLTRLLDPDTVLRQQIVTFVKNGEFGLATGQNKDGSFDMVWFLEEPGVAEIAFEKGVFLLSRERAKDIKEGKKVPQPEEQPKTDLHPREEEERKPERTDKSEEQKLQVERTIQLEGEIPPDLWNKFGIKVLTKMRSGEDLKVRVRLTSKHGPQALESIKDDLRQLLDDLELSSKVQIEEL